MLRTDNSAANPAREFRIMSLELDGCELFIPQTDVITFEDTQQLLSQSSDDLSIASVGFNEQIIPVFCLSDDFELLEYIPEKRKVCVIVGYQDRAVGLLCNNIHILSYKELKIEALPGCMKAKNTPLSTLFMYRQELKEAALGLMLRSESLIRYIDNEHQACA